MKFKTIECSQLKATHDPFSLRYHKLGLYDRVMFVDDPKTKYVLVDEQSSIIPSDTIDVNADVIFEKTINPQIDPRTYVCIKVGDKQRERLIIGE